MVTFSGSVQGVGFRYTTCRLAGDFDVTGFVRNVPDGTVEVVAEGTGQEIDRLLAAVSRRMHGYVCDMTQQRAAHCDEFRGFDVRF